MVRLERAGPGDADALAKMNKEMVEDEGYEGQLPLSKLRERMRGWLASGEYEAVFFLGEDGSKIGYALYQKQIDALYFTKSQVFSRHFFVARAHRKKGIGTQAFRALRRRFWAGASRVDLHVLIKNERAVGFWHSLGFREYQFGMELEVPGP